MKILLFSGGLDSSLIFRTLIKNGEKFKCIYINTNTPASKYELNIVSDQTKKFNIDLIVINQNKLKLVNDFYYQGRNALILSLACSISDKNDSIIIGINKSDFDDFPDCTEEFISSLSASFTIGYDVSIETPLLHKEKKDIIAESLFFSDFNYFSCYHPNNGIPCGVCLSCKGNEF